MNTQGKCPVAIIGAGNMASAHAKAFAALPNVRLAGIFSRTRARAEKLAAETGIEGVFSSVRELFERTKAALVIVTVPELEMRKVALECFAYPWTVLLEKPAGYNVSDAAALVDAAKSKEGKVFVGLNRRHYSSTRTVLADLEKRSGNRFVTVQDQQDTVGALKSGQPAEVVSHWMYANSIHTIDYLRVFCRGSLEKVQVLAPWTPEVPQVVAAWLSFSSGDQGVYHGIWRGPGPWAVQVSTPEIRWELRPLETASFQRAGERKLEQVPPSTEDVDFKAGFLTQAREAVKAAFGQLSSLPTVSEAFETMQIIQRIFRV